MDTFTLLIILFLVIVGYVTFSAGTSFEGVAEKGLGVVWEGLLFLWKLVKLFVLGIFVLPAMLIMAWGYPIWQGWIKGHGDWSDNLMMVIFIVPLSLLVLHAMIIMTLFHKSFEDNVSSIFGKKPF